MRVRSSALWGWAVLGFLPSCSCGGDDDDGASRLAELAEVGAEGGAFTLGGLVGVVPAGAVEDGGSVVVRGALSEDATPPDGSVGPVYELELDRELREPLTLELPYDVADLDGRSPLGLRVASSPDGVVWDCEPGTAPREQSTSVLAVVNHLSFWTLRFNPCDDDGDCRAPERCFDPGPSGYCATPCAGDEDCPSPTFCSCGICSRASCEQPGDDCPTSTRCSVDEGGQRGVCLPECTPLDRCGHPTEQQLCSPGGRCAFQQSALCEDLFACDAGDACWHHWCVSSDTGCDCGADCTCETPPDECPAAPHEACDNFEDDDGDDLVDCADLDCADEPACTGGLPGCPEAVADGCVADEDCGGDSNGNGLDDDCDGEVDEGCACSPGEVRPCSTAPPGRRTVGACEDGTMRCAGDGTWGACAGGVGPRPEVCNGADDDCDGCLELELDCGNAELACPEPGELAEAAPFQDFALDGTQFFAGVAGTWAWTVTGGPCDELLRRTAGVTSFTLSGEDTATPVFRPTLSGDYTVTMSATNAEGTPGECTFVVHARGPGLRVELCWDTTGTTDLDLHMHRPGTTTNWFEDVLDPNPDDCYWQNCKGGSIAPPANWGYAASPLSECEGGPGGDFWRLEGECRNPRLDIDNVATRGLPENINVDNPEDGQTYRVMVHHFNGDPSHPLVNVYCGGRLTGTYGAAPDLVETRVAGGAPGDALGMMWRVVDITPTVEAGETTGCDVEALHPPDEEAGAWLTVDDITY